MLPVALDPFLQWPVELYFFSILTNVNHISLRVGADMELARYKLDVVGVQEVRWDKGDTVREGDCDFFYEKENKNHQLGTDLFCTP